MFSDSTCYLFVPFIFETGNLPLIGSVLSALVIFLVVGVVVKCALRKKQNSKPTKKGTLYFITYFAQIAFLFFRIYGIVSFLNTFLISCQEFIDNSVIYQLNMQILLSCYN